MRDAVQSALGLCEILTAVFLLAYVLSIVKFAWKKLRRQTDESWAVLSPKAMWKEQTEKGNVKGAVIIAVIFALGVFQFVGESFFETTELGAFFEKRGEFEEQYEAYVYIDDKPVFCIAQICKSVDRGNESIDYGIVKIDLPYEKSVDILWEDYDYESENNQVYLGENMIRCKIVVGKVATQQSFEILKNTVVTAYGSICASRAGEKYHDITCPSASNISDKNMVFFLSGREASALCYRPCALCFGE